MFQIRRVFEGTNPNVYLRKPIEDSEKEGETFEPESGDLIALTHFRPTRIDDLTRPGDSHLIALVQRVKRKLRNESIHKIQILASKPINSEVDLQKDDRHGYGYGFAVSLINITTNMRIWNALRSDPEGRGMRILKKVLQPDSSVRTVVDFFLLIHTHIAKTSKY